MGSSLRETYEDVVVDTVIAHAETLAYIALLKRALNTRVMSAEDLQTTTRAAAKQLGDELRLLWMRIKKQGVT